MPYGTLADWRAYALVRGNSAPTDATNADASAALERASDYIRTRYVIRFTADYDDTEPEVEEATYIAASLELETPGFWSSTFTPSQAKVLTGVGDIRWTRLSSIGGGGADAMRPVSPAIDALMAPFTRSAIVGRSVRA